MPLTQLFVSTSDPRSTRQVRHDLSELLTVTARRGRIANLIKRLVRLVSIPLILSAGPHEGLLLQFEAISQFDEGDRDLARGVLEGLILKHQAKQSLLRQAVRSAPAPVPAKKPDAGSKRKAHTATAHR